MIIYIYFVCANRSVLDIMVIQLYRRFLSTFFRNLFTFFFIKCASVYPPKKQNLRESKLPWRFSSDPSHGRLWFLNARRVTVKCVHFWSFCPLSLHQGRYLYIHCIPTLQGKHLGTHNNWFQFWWNIAQILLYFVLLNTFFSSHLLDLRIKFHKPYEFTPVLFYFIVQCEKLGYD